MHYGRYRILKELGKGSMGVVYQAHDPNIDRLVALKVLRRDRVSSESSMKRFQKEARAVGRLSHPGIVILYDVGEDHGAVFLSMEFIEGEPLNVALQNRSFSVEDVVELGMQVAEALEYAHCKGIVHRDIKPSNIIVQPGMRFKITDFGIAHIEDLEDTQQTRAGDLLGTPAYMSPEQVTGHVVDGRADIFSLGVILYEAATGQSPFKGDNLAALFRSITGDHPQEPASLNPAIPMALSDTIMKCLEKDPQYRMPSGKKLVEALHRCRHNSMDSAPAAEPVQQKGRIGLYLSSLAAALVIIGIGWFFSSVQQEKTPHKPPAFSPDRRPAETHSTESVIDPSLAPSSPRTAASPTARKPGFLKIETTPAGAQVMVDGELKGTTPVTIQLPPGPHEVRLTLEAHGDWAAQVRVTEGGSVLVPVELFRLAATGDR